MICRKDVESRSMSISAPLVYCFDFDTFVCGAQITRISATSTSFRHLFDRSFLTGTSPGAGLVISSRPCAVRGQRPRKEFAVRPHRGRPNHFRSSCAADLWAWFRPITISITQSWLLVAFRRFQDSSKLNGKLPIALRGRRGVLVREQVEPRPLDRWSRPDPTADR